MNIEMKQEEVKMEDVLKGLVDKFSAENYPNIRKMISDMAMGPDYENLNDLLMKEFEKDKELIDKLESDEQLLELEDSLMKCMEANDAELNNAVYELPKGIEFEDEKYTRLDVGDLICYFLDKLEVEWSATQGLHDMYKFWRNNILKIPFKEFDSMLRTLGTVKFKGDREWRSILVINTFTNKCKKEYTRDIACMVYLSQVHNAMLERHQILSPVPVNEDGMALE